MEGRTGTDFGTYASKDDMMDQKMDQKSDKGSILRLSSTNVPATIPLNQGYYNGEDFYYIITDSNDKTHVDTISKNQNWKVELAPQQKNVPAKALSKNTYSLTA